MKNYFMSLFLLFATYKECWPKLQHTSGPNDFLSNSIISYNEDQKDRSKDFLYDGYKDPNPVQSKAALYEQCSMDLLSRFLTIEGVSFLITEIANYDGGTVKDILERLAKLHGFQVHRPRAISADLRRVVPSAAEFGEEVSVAAQQLTERRESDVAAPNRIAERAESLLGLIPGDHWVQKPNGYEVSVPNDLPQALLLLQSETADVLQRKWVNLAPRTSLLDVLKVAEVEYSLNGREFPNLSFNFKLKRLKSRGCIGLGSIGPLRGSSITPLQITIFTSTLEVEWDNPCLPKASDLLIYPGFVITISPFKA